LSVVLIVPVEKLKPAEATSFFMEERQIRDASEYFSTTTSTFIGVKLGTEKNHQYRTKNVDRRKGREKEGSKRVYNSPHHLKVNRSIIHGCEIHLPSTCRLPD
jgi:hypothetical protein